MPVFGGSGGQTTSARTLWTNIAPQQQAPLCAGGPRTSYQDPARKFIDGNGTTDAYLGDPYGYRVQNPVAGAGGWNDYAYVPVAISGNVRLQLSPANAISGYTGGGLQVTPAANNAAMNYGFEFGSDGSVYINQSASYTGPLTTWTAGDVFWIDYNHSAGTLAYYKGATFATAVQLSTTRTGLNLAGYYASVLIWDGVVGSAVTAMLDTNPSTTFAFSLTADVATFSYSGNGPALDIGYDFAAAVGTFSYSGSSPTLSLGYDFAAGIGSFSYSGIAIVERATLLGGIGSFAYSGVSPVLPVATLGGIGAFSYSGISPALTLAYDFAADTGSFSYSGITTGTIAAYSMPAAIGSFSYSGIDATLSYGRPMAGGTGVFSYLGPDTLMALTTLGGIGAFAYSGTATGLTAAYSLAAALGAFTYNGSGAPLGYGMKAAIGSFTYSGISPTLALHETMPGGIGVFSYSGVAVSFTLVVSSSSGGSGTGPRVAAVFYRR